MISYFLVCFFTKMKSQKPAILDYFRCVAKTVGVLWMALYCIYSNIFHKLIITFLHLYVFNLKGLQLEETGPANNGLQTKYR